MTQISEEVGMTIHQSLHALLGMEITVSSDEQDAAPVSKQQWAHLAVTLNGTSSNSSLY